MSLHCHVVLFKGLVTLVSSEGIVVRRVVGVSAPQSFAARHQQPALLNLHDPHLGPLVLAFLCHVVFHIRHVVLWINVYVNARKKTMRPPLHDCMESRILTRVPAPLNNI